MSLQNKTRIFLDSGDPAETREVIALLGVLDGQTTNPSLIAKNPDTAGKTFSKEEILDFYKGVVSEVSKLIPDGSVSIEVYADANTTADEMFAQGQEFYTWIPNPAPEQARYGAGAHIKYPTTAAGLEAAERSVKAGMRVNMTLVFSQSQAAAVYAATRGAAISQVFLSPFVGRLDDRGQNGMDLIRNISEMYRAGDGHVEILTASVRNTAHMQQAVQLGSDIITAPLKVLRDWKEGLATPAAANLAPISYENLDLTKSWRDYDIHHELTDKGLERFAADWNALIK